MVSASEQRFPGRARAQRLVRRLPHVSTPAPAPSRRRRLAGRAHMPVPSSPPSARGDPEGETTRRDARGREWIRASCFELLWLASAASLIPFARGNDRSSNALACASAQVKAASFKRHDDSMKAAMWLFIGIFLFLFSLVYMHNASCLRTSAIVLVAPCSDGRQLDVGNVMCANLWQIQRASSWTWRSSNLKTSISSVKPEDPPSQTKTVWPKPILFIVKLVGDPRKCGDILCALEVYEVTL
jgi:hypothetical protein